MASRAASGPRKRSRGSIDELPSGALRVRVHAGRDRVTGRRHTLVETIPAGPTAGLLAEKALARLLHQVDERKNPRTTATVDQLLDRYFEQIEADGTTARTYDGYARKHIRPFLGDLKVGEIDGDVIDSFYAELRRCREHCDRRPYVEHRTPRPHDCDDRCRPHVCSPLSSSTIRQIHFILSGAFRKAVRWRFLAVNPFAQAEPPAAPKPNPKPPSAADAARIVNEASRDPDWAAFIWLAMTTGARRGELCGLRWANVDLDNGVLVIERSIAQSGSRVWEKDTKTHQQRRVTLDPETLVVLKERRARCDKEAARLQTELSPRAFVFSSAPDGSTFLRPNSVGERYIKLAARLGIDTTLHRLRHYNATELIAAGVDVRTVAGRLGHSGGGSTTLRVYSAWLSESDQRAAGNLGDRMPARQRGMRVQLPALPPPSAPYQESAHRLAEAIANGDFLPGEYVPSSATLANEHSVSGATARRALAWLASHDVIETIPGRGAKVSESLKLVGASKGSPSPAESAVNTPPSPGRRLMDLQVRLRGEVLTSFTAEADPTNALDLRKLLERALRRTGRPKSDVAEAEMDLRLPGKSETITTFIILD